MWISDVTPCARFGRGIVHCPFRGVSGIALSEMRNHFSE